MSYVLHIWEHPNTHPWPDNVQEVDNFLSISRSTKLGQNTQFLTLAKQLTNQYPCICSPEAEDIPETQWAWSDGPLDGKTESMVYSIGLNNGMLDEVHPFVIKEANGLGLSVMDEQAGEVYLANGRVLAARLRVEKIPAPKSAYDDVPKARAFEQILFERLTPFLQKYGFKARKSDTSFKCKFPNGWHEISINTTDRWPSSCEFSLGAVSRFHAVNECIASINDQGRSPDDLKGWCTTIAGQRSWMDETGGFINEKNNKAYEFNSYSQVEAVLEHVFTKLEMRLLPLLEQYKTIQGLDQLLNPNPVKASIYFDGYEYGAHHIITAYLAGNPRLEELCEEFLTRTAHIKHFSHLLELTKQCIEYVRNNPTPSTNR